MRRAVAGAFVVGTAAALYWARPETPPPPTPVAMTRPIQADPVQPPPVSQPAKAEVVTVSNEAKPVLADRLEESCGLIGAPTCTNGTCVVMAALPNLDSPLGWASMLWEAPTFVATTAARDLGVPRHWTACGKALEGLRPFTIELSDGRHLVCAPTAGTNDKEAARLCEEQSLSRFAVGGFSDQHVRRLNF